VKRLAPLLLVHGCAMPVVSAGTFLPAGDLKKGQLHASVSLEMGRVLAAPSDVDSKETPQASQWEVSTWIASDVSARYALTDRVALEAQLKLTNPITPFRPEPVGAAAGARVRLVERAGDRGLSVELGGRVVGMWVRQELRREKSGGEAQTDRWSYRAVGVEAPLVVTMRWSGLLALTVAPFARAYWIRAFHDVVTVDGEVETTRLDWTPVLSAGVGASVALQLGPIEVAPGLAVELATRPGPTASTKVLLQPGLNLGMRF